MKQKIFIVLFILSLGGPPLLYPLVKDYLNTENYENRTLAQFPELSLKNFVNIPAQFESYFNDHAPFKNFFVNLNAKLETKLFGVTTVGPITIGTDNWLFYTVDVEGENAIFDYQHINLYTSAQKEEIRADIQAAAQEMAEQGIRFFLFEAPNKETIYNEYMPKKIRVYGEESRLKDLIPKLQNQGLPVYDLTDSLEKYADDFQIYYKYDTHWNPVGAYIASQQIAQVLLGTYVPLEEVEVVSGTPISGDLAGMLNMVNEYMDDTNYSVEGYLPEITAVSVEADDTVGFEVFHSDSPNKKTLLVLGDSFTHGLKPYLPKLYETVVFVTFGAYTPELFEEYQIDDFIYLNVERNQRYLENIPEVLRGELH